MTTMQIKDNHTLRSVCGLMDSNLTMIRERVNANIEVNTSGTINIYGRESVIVENVLRILQRLAQNGYPLAPLDVSLAINAMRQGYHVKEFLKLYDMSLGKFNNGQNIHPRTFSQQRLAESIRDPDATIIFGSGSAGTGKTLVSLAMGIEQLNKHDVNRIVITRPISEVGNDLGFLPGSEEEKYDPYLQPISEILTRILGEHNKREMIARGNIQLTPLLYLRGETLDNAFIVFDEAQNTTPHEMKTFISRIGDGSKMVINGDETQSDLYLDCVDGEAPLSGLSDAISRLESLVFVRHVKFANYDIVRSWQLQQIMEAYDK